MTIRIGVISDTHGRHKQLKVDPCDILIHAGDFTSQGYKHEATDFFRWFKGQPAMWKIFIEGNHELGWDRKDENPWIQELLNQILDSNTLLLEDSSAIIMGIKFWGTPWQPKFCNWAFNLPRGERLAEKYRLMPDDTDILISHGPAYGIEDYIPKSFLREGETDVHVGCFDLLSHIRKSELKYHIFGHIHLDDRSVVRPVEYSHDERGESRMQCINAAVLNNRYELVCQPYYFNYEV